MLQAKKSVVEMFENIPNSRFEIQFVQNKLGDVEEPNLFIIRIKDITDNFSTITLGFWYIEI